MSYSNINKSSDFFKAVLHNGNGGTQSITGIGHQPDMVWIKRRNGARNHQLQDVVRGITKQLVPNETDAEATNTEKVKSIQSDGFTLGTNQDVNASGDTFVSWNWKANGAGSTNYDGSITSTVSAGITQGMSIVKYTGNQTNGATVGHGLGAVPKMIIIKNLNDAEHWTVYHNKLSPGHQLYLNLTNAQNDDASEYYDTTPTSSVFTLGNSDRTNNVNIPYIAYCFAEKTGYSKFGSFVGNGSSDGVFCYTGMKPAWVLIKQINTTNNWLLFDNKRPGYNLTNNFLEADNTGAEAVNNPNQRMDILSNGFKIRGTGSATNTSGGTYIYMSFGQSIVGSNNIPATAR